MSSFFILLKINKKSKKLCKNNNLKLPKHKGGEDQNGNTEEKLQKGVILKKNHPRNGDTGQVDYVKDTVNNAENYEDAWDNRSDVRRRHWPATKTEVLDYH
jgi:hypothetical protein